MYAGFMLVSALAYVAAHCHPKPRCESDPTSGPSTPPSRRSTHLQLVMLPQPLQPAVAPVGRLLQHVSAPGIEGPVGALLTLGHRETVGGSCNAIGAHADDVWVATACQVVLNTAAQTGLQALDPSCIACTSCKSHCCRRSLQPPTPVGSSAATPRRCLSSRPTSPTPLLPSPPCPSP